MAKVIAVRRGHDGVDVREEGEVFTVPDERLKDGSDWFVPVDKAPPKVVKVADSKGRPAGAGPLPGSRVKESDE